MKRKILVPMFASVMALSMNSISNADEIVENQVENTENQSDSTLNIGEYQESTYKKAVVKDGVAVKVREQGSVQQVAYTGDEFKVIATQGEWVKVKMGESEGWLAARFVDLTEASGYTTSEKVNFRSEANTDSEIIEELEIGSTVKVLETEGEWLKVSKGDKEGYISSLYVSDEAPVIEVEEEVVVEQQETTQTSNNTQTNNNTQNNSNAQSSNRPNTNNQGSSNQGSGQAQKPPQEQAAPPASSSSAVQAVINLAYSKIGSPYVWGAEGPNAFDCSGLTSYVFRNAAGVSLPRTSSAQSGYGQTVSKANLQPGDLVFFNTSGSGVSHVGIYVGGGNMVHSPTEGSTVHVTSINSSYYSSRFVTAKRVL